MRHPFDEAGAWIADFGSAYTGLGSGGTNALQWSIRTTADAAVSGYDWADHTNVLELAGGLGQYVVAFPANVVGAAGRYVIRARTASGGKYLSEELIFAASQYTGADTAGTTTLLSRLTSTRAGLLDHLDADISSRLATAGYTTPPTAAAIMAAILDELASNHNTAGTVGKLLQNLDAAVSSRLATSGYTTPPTAAAIMAAILDELASNHNTAGTVGKLLQNLDAAVSTRLAAAGYTAPASLASIVAGIWDELQAGHSVAGSFGARIDAAISSRSTYAGADTPGTTTLLARLTAGRAGNLDNLDAAVSGVAAAVWNVLTAGISTANSIGKLIRDNLDAAISTRLASSSYSAPPAAAAIADSVWDELLSGHTVSGSAGDALGSVGAAADPLQNDVPGAYPPGTAGAALGALASTPVTVTVTSPVNDSGDVTVVRGDDYFTADGGRVLSWTLSGTLPDYTGATVEFLVADLAVAAVVTNPAGSPRTITVELSSAQTTPLARRAHGYAIRATLSNGHKTTPVLGELYARDAP